MIQPLAHNVDAGALRGILQGNHRHDLSLPCLVMFLVSYGYGLGLGLF